jgi:GNAT superfamily N-acetyltransferase
MINIDIRDALAFDAGRIHQLHLISVRALCAPFYETGVIDGWLGTRTPEGYLASIARGALFVAVCHGHIVGFGESSQGEIRALFVDPEWSGQGVGTALLKRAMTRAALESGQPVRLESTLNAVAFYERHGFRATERRTLRRNHVDVPVVVMEAAARTK